MCVQFGAVKLGVSAPMARPAFKSYGRFLCFSEGGEIFTV